MYNLGLLFLFSYNLITATKSVYVSSLLQHINPFQVLSVSFAVVTVIFLSILYIKGTVLRSFEQIIKLRNEALKLCSSTLLGWVTFYFSLKFIEPAIVTAITSASGPILTAMIFKREIIARGDSGNSQIDRLFSVLIFAVMSYLVWQTLIGQSSVGRISMADTVLGFSFAVICGFSNVLNTIFSKRLNSGGLGSLQILSFRFIPLFFLSGLTTQIMGNTFSDLTTQDLTNIVMVAILGITIPIFMFQEGIRRSTPMIVAYVHATIPIFVLLIQFFDTRLKVTVYSISGIILVSVLSLLSILIKNSKLENKTQRVL